MPQRRGRAATDTSMTNSCPSLALEVEDAVVRADAQPGEGDAVARPSHVVHSATPRGRRGRGACRARRARARPTRPARADERADHGRRQVALLHRGVVGQQRTEESLAGGADEERQPEPGEHVESAEQLPVLRAALREAEARVEDEPLVVDAGRDERVDAGRELVAHLGDHVAVVGEGVHAVGVPAPVHGDVVRRRVSATMRRHRGIGEAAGDVVDDLGARLDRGERRWPRSSCRRSPGCRARRARARRAGRGAAPPRARRARRRAGSTPRRRR